MRDDSNPVGTPYYHWPCQGCTERHPGCHAECSRYAEAKTEHGKMKVAYNNAKIGPASIEKEIYIAKRKMRKERYKSNHKPNH